MARGMAKSGMAGMVGVLLVGLVAGAAGPATACGGLVGRGGTVQLGRTTTLAAYADGMEHYVTAFTYQGGGAKFGSIVPLPGVPTDVRKGGAWTLQRLVRETHHAPRLALAATSAEAGLPEVLQTKRIDALDITILRGGGSAVGTWARRHGFDLSVDAPEVLDFYAARSPVFMAATFDPGTAERRGQQVGDGTPIQLTIPTGNPWVPLRILGLGHQPAEPIEADVYLLTDHVPALLPTPQASPGADPPFDEGTRPGLVLDRSGPASPELLADLRADKDMGWLPASGMWLTALRVDTVAGALTYDLAVDASDRAAPSRVAAGLAPPAVQVESTGHALWRWGAALLVALAGAVLALLLGRPARASRPSS